MNIGIYKSASAMVACDRRQEMISQNISAASVPGYKRTEGSFESKVGDLERYGADTRVNKEMRGSIPKVSSQINMAPGEIKVTGNATDVAIQGRGFFKVQIDKGQDGYTRDGEFHLDSQRTLVNKQGLPVLSDSGPITLKPDGGNLAISPDGTVSQGETSLGKLQLYDFPDSQKLNRLGNGLLAPEDPNVQPKAVEKPELAGGMLEMSNVQPLQEMVNMITVSRAYEANQRVVTSQDDLVGKAIQSLSA